MFDTSMQQVCSKSSCQPSQAQDFLYYLNRFVMSVSCVIWTQPFPVYLLRTSLILQMRTNNHLQTLSHGHD